MANRNAMLEEKLHIRSTNLQCIRFFAAILVILCHSVPLSLGAEYMDVLGNLTRGNITFGGFAVAIFFFVSGFYAIQGASKFTTFTSFFKKKIKRMLPPLFLVVCCSAFIVGPIVTSLSIIDYFTSAMTYQYLLNGIFILQHELPGVFLNHIYNPTVNGALWTMPVEFACIIGCFIYVKLHLHNKKSYLFLVGCILLGYMGANYIFKDASFMMSVLTPCVMFFVGFGYYIFRDRIVLSKKLFFSFLLLFCVLFVIGFSYYACIIFLPYIILFLSYGCPQKCKRLKLLGDCSYELYLWGFVVQQCVVEVYGGSMEPVWNAIISIPIVILLGFVTHNMLMKFSRKKEVRT